MKTLLLTCLTLLFLSIPAMAQQPDSITLSDEDNLLLNTELTKFYGKRDSLEYYKKAKLFIEEEIDRLNFEKSLQQTVLEYRVDQIIKKYQAKKDYEFKYDQETKTWSLRRKVNGDDSGS